MKFIDSYKKQCNPFQANIPFLYPLKVSENLWFSRVFRGYRNGILAWNRLNYLDTIPNSMIKQTQFKIKVNESPYKQCGVSPHF